MAAKNARPADKEIAVVRNILKKGKIVCLTGAGISYESGIPTFRGNGGLWETYDPEVYGNMPGLVSIFRKSPEKLVGFISDFYNVLLQAKPNPAHLCLSYLEKSSLLKAVITQNIDNLHQQAGTRSIVELHGNAFRVRCRSCGATLKLEKDRVKEMVSLLKKARSSRVEVLKIFSRYCPRCLKCKGRFRIDIVLFGEQLDETDLSRSRELLDDCRALLIVGSSLVVYPAASLPLYAKERGAKIIEINSQPSALSDICDFKIMGAATEILPEIIRVL
ncbi:MAG: NAD-dependent deacylase [Candidatus Omnitrophica bacterium]|nr:NAD-dependent deacylase [Candidatus Omnitrophota bacterium]